MAKERPLKIEIPKPADDHPAWSRVGIIGAAGFVLGIAWPKAAGVKVGPNVPGDLRPTTEASAQPSAAPTAAPATPPTGSPTAAPAAAPAENKQTVAVGPGKITRCWDKKSKKVTDCGELQLDNIAVPKLKDLAACPSAVGLSGKLGLAIEIDFDKKEVHVAKARKDKTSIPSSTVTGIVQCATKGFANLPLEEVPHKFKHYSVQYGLTFVPPGKGAEGEAGADKEGEGGEDAAGSTTSETGAEGTATVIQDTGLVRKEPKDGEVVARLVRGTKVKIVGRRNEWYKIDAGGKTGWIYRGAIGL